MSDYQYEAQCEMWDAIAANDSPQRTVLVHLNITIPRGFTSIAPDRIADNILAAIARDADTANTDLTIVCPLAEEI